jgi:branched-chain amino acid transport system ATP-binding protein
MLEVRNINVAYGDVQALWDCSFSVKEREVVTLIGSNGAGKTTALRAISGLLPPKSGKVTFEGQDVTGIPPYKLVERGMALVPEARQLWPGMTVQENLELGAYTRAARAKLTETLKRVYDLFPRLHDRRAQLAGTLSGGEQQMCAIGRGLMSLPRLMMLDEPSLGLAPMLVREVFGVVKEIKNQGVTVVLVEQNVGHALEVADRAYVLETGRITLTGRSHDLLGDPTVQEKFLGVGVD